MASGPATGTRVKVHSGNVMSKSFVFTSNDR
jgi:hypothetical protein